MGLGCSAGGVVTLASRRHATSHNVPRAIALYGSYVYWIDPGDHEVGGADLTLADDVHNPGDIVTNASAIYVAGNGTVVRIPKAPQAFITSFQPSSKIAWLVAVDAQHVYWVAGSGDGFGKLRKAPLDASQAGVVLTVAGPPASPSTARTSTGPTTTAARPGPAS